MTIKQSDAVAFVTHRDRENENSIAWGNDETNIFSDPEKKVDTFLLYKGALRKNVGESELGFKDGIIEGSIEGILERLGPIDGLAIGKRDGGIDGSNEGSIEGVIERLGFDVI